MHKILRKKRSESGVALLFAIGLLALMIMLCVSFSMESLQSQKSASNNSNRSAAKVLAQSAINHVSTSILMYRDKHWDSVNVPAGFIGNGSVNVLPTDLSIVVSRDSKSEHEDGLDKLLPFRTAYIGKYYGGENAASGGETSYKTAYDTASRKPHWTYVTGKGESDGTQTVYPIVGRFAYRVLPPTSSTQINYSYYVSGNQKMTGGSGNGWARDISFVGNELKPDNTFLASAPLDFYAACKSISKADYDLAQRFFSDGAVPGDLEVFKVNDGTNTYYCHRYNITQDPVVTGDTDEAKVNSLLDQTEAKKRVSFFSFDDLVDAKKTAGMESKNTDRSYYQEKNYKDGAKTSNLFFLGMIANDAASFDGLGTRRKQIAANYLDYCDADGKPTSDSIDWATNPPSYTGNERSLYINELAFMTKISASTVGDAATAIDVKLVPNMAAELVDIYGTIKIGDTLLSGLNETATVGKLNCEISSIKVKFTGEAKIKSEANPRTEKIDTTVDFENVKFKDMIFKKSDWNNGYYAALSDGYHIGDSTAKAKNSSIDKSIAIDGLAAGESIESFNLKATSMEITLNRSCYLNSGDVNVDFTRLPTEAQTVALSMESDLTREKGDVCFTIGNMSVKDPRQNLNINTAYSKASNTGTNWKKSDWVFDMAAATNSASVTGLSMDIDIDDTTKLPTSVTGKVNTYSSPKDSPASYMGDKMNGDLEEVTDPAYINETRMSTAYIRNGNMQSMWELGMIHRGAAWETINLQGSSVTPADMHTYLSGASFAGTDYADGDAAIFDTVKLSQYAVNWGMVDVNMLRGANSVGYDYTGAGRDKKFYDELLTTLIKHKNPETIQKNASDKDSVIFEAVSDAVRDGFITVFEGKPEMTSRSQIANLYDGVFDTNFPTDSSREELIGKLMPLIKTEPALVTVFHVDIVAQTIKDVGGVSVSKIKKNGDLSAAKNTTLGTFDTATEDGETIYFDEITGQVKLRATFDCNPFTGKVKLRQIKYLD